MDLPKLVFLSHSSQDEHLARSLEAEIKSVFGDLVDVFVSSRPDALESGEEWRPRVIDSLGKADILTVLLTRASENSAWVGFEAGYFWHKEDGKNLHILRHPEASIPHPIDVIQAKSLTSADEFRAFFVSLARTLGNTLSLEPEVDRLVEIAGNIEARISERSLRYFENMLSNSLWEHMTIDRYPTTGEVADLIAHGTLYDNYIATKNEVWVCIDDVVLQIVKDYSTREEFEGEEWIAKHPYYSLYTAEGKFAYRYLVYLTISGVQIREVSFISLDGGHCFIPMPSIKSASINDPEDRIRREFVWKRDSLEYKVALVIGDPHDPDSLDDLALSLGIIVE